MKAMGMNKRAQGHYLDVEEDLNTGRGGGISKGHSKLGAEMYRAVWQKPGQKKL